MMEVGFEFASVNRVAQSIQDQITDQYNYHRSVGVLKKEVRAAIHGMECYSIYRSNRPRSKLCCMNASRFIGMSAILALAHAVYRLIFLCLFDQKSRK